MCASFRQAHVDGNGADVERCSAASSFPNRLCLEDDGFPRPTPVTHGVPQSVRRARPEQQSDSLPAGQRQHLRAGSLRHARPDQHRRRHGGRFASGDERRQAVRPRQPLHGRRQHRPQLDQFHLVEHARLHQSRSFGHDQSGDPGQRADHPHARQYRFRPGQSRRAEHLFRPLRDRHVRHHVAAFGDARAGGSTSRRSRWPT